MTVSKPGYSILFAIALLFLLHAVVSAGTTFTASLDGAQEQPSNITAAAGTGTAILNTAETQVTVTFFFTPLAGSQTSAAIHGPAPSGSTGPVIFTLPSGNITQTFAITSQQAADLKAGLWYFEIRSTAFPLGEIRGQIAAATGTAVPFPSSRGALDPTFGTNGALSAAVGAGNDVAQAVAIQPDGKIVVAGYAFTGANNDFALIRYNADGTLDAAFDGSQNGNGIVTTAIGSSSDEAFAVAIQGDGKIVLAGQTFNGVDTDIAFARYNTDGTLDNTFDGDGRATVTAGVGSDLVRSVAMQADGKIVAAGNAANGTNNDIVVVRLEPNGALDTSFDGNAGNGNGVILTQVGSSSDFGYGVAVQGDGKIVVAGFYISATSNDTAILRYNADGVLDSSFDADGIKTHSFSNSTDEALSMALQSDGKIVIAGCIRATGANDFLLARFNQNGDVDTSFGASGSIVVPFSTVIDIAMGVAIQPDGKIVAAGFGSNGTDNDFSVTRVNADGTLDASFDGDGKLQTAVGTSADSANAIAVQADGKIVVVGRTVIGATSDLGVVRYGYGSNGQDNDGFIALNSTTAVRFVNAHQSGNSFVKILNSAAMPPLPALWSAIGSPRVIGTSALFSGNILVRLTLPASIDPANFNAVRVLQFENGAWNDKTAISPPRDFASKTVYALISSLDPLVAASPNGPVTGTSAIYGRLLTPGGRAAVNTLVTVRSATGAQNYTLANPFGYFRFKSLERGESFVVSVSSKRYSFAPQLISLQDDITEIDLVAR